MKLYDVNIHTHQGGIDFKSEIVIAKTPVEAAIAVLEKLKDFQESSPLSRDIAGEKLFSIHSNFELRCFERSSAHVL